MAYNPTHWADGVTPVNALHLNKNERGIEQQGLDVEVLSEYIAEMDVRISEDIQVVSEFVAELDTKVTDGLENIDPTDIAYVTEADSNITSVKDALDKLLYVTLSISFSSNTQSVLEKGSSINGVTFNWSYNKAIASQTFDGAAIDKSIRTYTYSEPLVNNRTSVLSANDGKSNFSKSIAFSFVYPIYIGSVPADAETPTEDQIKAMSKKVVSPSNQSLSYNINNERMCIAVPSNWSIRSIIDPNNFDITGSFKLKNVGVVCLDDTTQTYKVYVSEPTSQSGFLVKFNI